MYSGEVVYYNGYKLDKYTDNIKTLTRRKEYGMVTKINNETGWIEVTLKSGIKVTMHEDKMKIACGVKI